MPNPLDIAPAVQLAPLVTFSWGAIPTMIRYCRWTSPITIGPDVFSPLPRFEVDYGDQTGGARDEPIRITIDASADPVPRLDHQRYGPISVTVEECDPQSPVSTRRVRFSGIVDRSTFNVNGRSGVARLTISGRRAGMDVSLGLLIDQSCDYIFGDPRSCKKNLAPLRVQSSNLVIGSIVGTQVTLSGSDISLATGVDPWRWHRGSLAVDGYAIMIRRWQTGTLFDLVRPPPSDWLGAAPTLTPGCDHSLDGPNGCRYWSNESEFGGIGLRMPNRDPRFEGGVE